MKNWYAVYTKINNEKRVSTLLSKKKVENYCPQNRVTQPTNGYKRRLESEPLFPSFVFIYITEAEITFLKKINFVIDFVYWLGNPVVITEVEIENIKLFIQQYENIVIEKSRVNSGGITRIINGKNNNTAFVETDSAIKLQLPSLGFTMVAQLTLINSDELIYQLERSKLVV